MQDTMPHNCFISNSRTGSFTSTWSHWQTHEALSFFPGNAPGFDSGVSLNQSLFSRVREVSPNKRSDHRLCRRHNNKHGVSGTQCSRTVRFIVEIRNSFVQNDSTGTQMRLNSNREALESKFDTILNDRILKFSSTENDVGSSRALLFRLLIVTWEDFMYRDWFAVESS